MFRTDNEEQASELVLTQKMNGFNARFAAVVSIKGVLVENAPLAKAVLGDELEIEFEDRRIGVAAGIITDGAMRFAVGIPLGVLGGVVILIGATTGCAGRAIGAAAEHDHASLVSGQDDEHPQRLENEDRELETSPSQVPPR